MKFGSLFTGIGGFDLGFERAGMECVWQVEKDQHCKRVLSRHWPHTERHNDVNEFSARTIPDVVCGGFPCQDLSVAGKRAGLAGQRSGLFHQFMRIIGEAPPRWVVIENVPGLLSSNEGRDMRTVLTTLAKLGYGFAYRILDAQWFGVAQRRRRVFIVGCFGDWRSAAQILFERESLPWNSAPSREAGARVADPITSSFAKHGGASAGKDSRPRNAIVTHALTHDGFDASEDGTGRGTPLIAIDDACFDRSGDSNDPSKPTGFGIRENAEVSNAIKAKRPHAVAYQCHGSNVGPAGTFRAGNGNETGGVPFIVEQNSPCSVPDLPTQRSHGTQNYAVAIPLDMRQCSRGEKMTNNRDDGGAPGTGIGNDGDPAPSIAESHPPAVAFAQNQRGELRESEISPQITCGGGKPGEGFPAARNGMLVRRLTPRECERLQGFPDDWTRYGDDDSGIPDSPRYRMCGNAVAVPVAHWIGQRLMEISR